MLMSSVTMRAQTHTHTHTHTHTMFQVAHFISSNAYKHQEEKYMGLFTKLGNICGILPLIPCNLNYCLFSYFQLGHFILGANKKHLRITDTLIHDAFRP